MKIPPLGTIRRIRVEIPSPDYLDRKNIEVPDCEGWTPFQVEEAVNITLGGEAIHVLYVWVRPS